MCVYPEEVRVSENLRVKSYGIERKPQMHWNELKWNDVLFDIWGGGRGGEAVTGQKAKGRKLIGFDLLK